MDAPRPAAPTLRPPVTSSCHPNALGTRPLPLPAARPCCGFGFNDFFRWLIVFSIAPKATTNVPIFIMIAFLTWLLF